MERGGTGLGESIAAVREEHLTSERAIHESPMNRVRASNFIPPRAEELYAAALVEEYHKATRKQENGKTRTG